MQSQTRQALFRDHLDSWLFKTTWRQADSILCGEGLLLPGQIVEFTPGMRPATGRSDLAGSI